MFSIYDKGLSDSPLIQIIQNISKYAEQEVTDCTELKNLQESTIAIVHVSDDEWTSLLKDYSPPDSIRVRVISGDSCDELPIKEDSIYKFHLMIGAGDLTAKDWKEILSGLSDSKIVEDLVHGENPNGLRHFFVREKQEHLAALVILCEGYLAVHAGDGDYHGDIRHALNLMKWSQFRDSDGSQEWIRQDLGGKMDDVCESVWWLTVFEQQSFYDNIKQQWETAGGKEIPEPLNPLLEAIRNGETIESPKIVADAYCVLAEKRTITKVSEWQIQCHEFHHDWLKDKFLNRFDSSIVQLKKSEPNLDRMRAFLKKDFPASKCRLQDAQRIVDTFEDKMSPRQLLNYSPLNRCDRETATWLGNLTHKLWLSRYPVKSKIKESRDALVTVNKMYPKIENELGQSGSIESTELIPLLPQFSELRETYKVLSKVLINLSRYESHGK